MSTFSLEKTRKEAAARRAKEHDAEKKIQDLLQDVKKTSTAMQAALDAGNAKEYTRSKERRDNLEKRIMAARAEMMKQKPYATRDAALSAWNGYAAEYNADFTEALLKYEKDKKKLCEQYLQLVEMQADALNSKQDLEALAAEYDLKDSAWNPSELKYLPEDAPELELVERTVARGYKFWLCQIAANRQRTDKEPDTNIDPRFMVSVYRQRKW